MRSLIVEVEPPTLLLKVRCSPTDLKLNKLRNPTPLLQKDIVDTILWPLIAASV